MEPEMLDVYSDIEDDNEEFVPVYTYEHDSDNEGSDTASTAAKGRRKKKATNTTTSPQQSSFLLCDHNTVLSSDCQHHSTQ
jgi:hypothetical protein